MDSFVRHQMLAGIIPPSEKFAAALATTPSFRESGCTTGKSVIDLFVVRRVLYQQLNLAKFVGLPEEKLEVIYFSLETTLDEEREKCVSFARRPGWVLLETSEQIPVTT